MSESSVEPVTVLRVMAEGGSIALLVRCVPAQSFALRVRDQCLQLIDEGEGYESVTHWGTWDEAVRVLERYPWRNLYPVEVNEAWSTEVWELVNAHSKAEGCRRLSEWSDLCGHAAG